MDPAENMLDKTNFIFCGFSSHLYIFFVYCDSLLEVTMAPSISFYLEFSKIRSKLAAKDTKLFYIFFLSLSLFGFFNIFI